MNRTACFTDEIIGFYEPDALSKTVLVALNLVKLDLLGLGYVGRELGLHKIVVGFVVLRIVEEVLAR